MQLPPAAAVHIVAIIRSVQHILVGTGRINDVRGAMCCRYQVEREIQIHINLLHHHIIRLHAAFEDPEHVYLVQVCMMTTGCRQLPEFQHVLLHDSNPFFTSRMALD